MRSDTIRQKEKSNLDPEDRLVLEAMDQVAGYLDITPEDFLDILHRAHELRQSRGQTASVPDSPMPVANLETMTEPAPPLRRYLSKMRATASAPGRVSLREIFLSWVGSFLGILAVAWIHFVFLTGTDLAFMIGSFGASAVLIYGAIKSPLAQPRNLVGGHVVSALIGSALYMVFPQPIWLTSALAVSLAIAAMHWTRTLHPPGGATALIAVIGSSKIHALGLWYAILPVGLGATTMLLIALLVNNLDRERKYPEFWI